MRLLLLVTYYLIICFRSATVTSYFGPSKNPWQSGLKYKLRNRHKESYSNECNKKPSYIKAIENQLENEDFYVSGGSSGGGAISVATGACFGYDCFLSINLKILNRFP